MHIFVGNNFENNRWILKEFLERNIGKYKSIDNRLKHKYKASYA